MINRRVTNLLWCLVISSWVALAARPSRAQTSWEVTPYDVKVLIALAPAPELTNELRKQLEEAFVRRLHTLVGAAWNTVAEKACQAIAFNCIHQPDLMSVNQFALLNPELLEHDKVFVVAIDRTMVGFKLQVRELDCRTRSWGRWIRRSVLHSSELVSISVDTLIDAFSPVAKIGRPIEDPQSTTVSDKKEPFQKTKRKQERFRVRLRAGALVTKDDSPVLAQPGAILRPVLRRNDRLGRPRPGGVRPIPWTYLMVVQSDGSELECVVHSGIRSPISARVNHRTERLALVIQPPQQPTRLQLRSRDDPNGVLAGYKVYSRPPNADESLPSENIGQSDFRGWVTIPPGLCPLRILYIKNGRALLARLPMVPGLENETSVAVFDDDIRLEAEGFVLGMQQDVVDRVVERKILAMKVRKRIEAGQLDEAKRQLDELQSLRLPSHYSLELGQERRRLATSKPRVQKKINALFSQTQKLLSEYDDARDVATLIQELSAARQTTSE